jgi:hypothetical protein
MGKGLAGYFRVAGGGNNYAYGANRTPHLFQACEGPDSKFGRQLPGSFGAKVIDSYELRSRDLLQSSRVFLTVLTRSDYRNGYLFAQIHLRKANNAVIPSEARNLALPIIHCKPPEDSGSSFDSERDSSLRSE